MSAVRDLGDAKICLLWAKQHSRLFSALSFNIIRETCAYLPPPLVLVWVEEHSLTFFNFSSLVLERPVPLTTRVNVNHNSTWSLVNRNIVVLCGGGGKRKLHTDKNQAWHTAYLLHRQGEVRALPDLTYGRSGSGVVMWRGAVHVFGSRTPEGSQQVERLRLSRGSRWKHLPELPRQRWLFTAVVWQRAVYLCGGNYIGEIDVWDGEEFSTLEIKLSTTEGYNACAVGEELYILGNTTLAVLTKKSNQISTHNWTSVRSNTAAVLFGTTLFRLENGIVMQHNVLK